MDPFPAEFLWGTATASYQVEGAVTEDGRGLSIWDTFARTPGRVADGDTGDVACDHYHRYPHDVALMRELGIGAYRFSVAWPRIQPDGRRVEPRGLDFYDRLVDTLVANGIRPVLTLYHWDLPQALQDRGGWGARDTVDRFVEYATTVHSRLSDRVEDWTTFNEPWCVAFLGHHEGVHAPGLTDAELSLRVLHHVFLAHGRAVAAMRSSRGGRMSIVLNLSPVIGDDPEAVRRMDGLNNRLFLDPILRGRYPEDVIADLAPITDFEFVREDDLADIGVPLDFLGVNYYSPARVAAGPDEPVHDAVPGLRRATVLPPEPPFTAMGWEQNAEALHDLLTRLGHDHPGTPLMITENGAAFDDRVGAEGAVHDPDRIAFLAAHLAAVRRAIDEGVDVRGYFAWSLLDNFEWAYGYGKRFGLVHVDYATQQRTVKDSGRWYAEVARSGRLPD
jgi:beta-glucosidase